MCISDYNKSNRKPIACLYCNYKSCSGCTRQYLLNSTRNPDCMSCHVEWNREFIDDNFPKTFRTGELKKHRELVLLEREKSLLPSTMPLIELHRDIENEEKEAEKLRLKMEQANRHYYMKVDDISRLRRRYHRLETGHATDVSERKNFVRNCPAGECKGFLSTQWKCGLCETWVCPDCHEIKAAREDTNHTCKPENVETAKALAKDTRPCPKCAAAIFKIDGCDQMWCTLCHTAFSWRTGNIETTRVHNPHYYEWMRRQNNGVIPREPGDGPQGCGDQMIDVYTLRRLMTNARVDATESNTIAIIHRMITHVENWEMQRFNVPDRLDQYANQDLRIRYFLEGLDEETWKSQLQQREKKWERKRAMRQVLTMFVNVAKDLMRKVQVELTSGHNGQYEQNRNRLSEILDEFEELRKYFNDSSFAVCKRFESRSLFRLDNNWSFNN